MNKLIASAYQYISNGICIIAVNAEKRAFLPWKKYQDQLITLEEAELQFERPEACSLAVVCGKPSGNLEVIDVDQKYSLDGNLFTEYCQAIKDNDHELFDRLMIVQTVSPGYHIYYRCAVILGNQKLASRETTSAERSADPNDKIRVLIETRGQGGYVVAPPSKGYKIIHGAAIPTITPEERELLIELARSFNRVLEQPVKNHTTHGYNPKEYGLSPFEDYNKRGDVVGLLVQHGWKVIREQTDRVVFRRPGKDVGTSGDYLMSKQWFSVFTTSSVFEPNKAYLPYAVYAVLECNGDFKAASRKLLTEGYGERREYYGDKVERELYKKKKEGLTNDQLASYLRESHNKNEEQAREIVDKMTVVWGEKICTFWDVDEKQRVTINQNRLVNFLFHTGGFSLYYYDTNSTIYRVVRCVDGFLEEVSSEHVKKFLKHYIENLPDTFDGGITGDDLIELIIKGSESFFSKGKLEFLNRGYFDFLKDTDKEAFFPFRNGVIRVDKEGVTLLGYKDIKKVIWKSQVIDFEIIVDENLDSALVEYAGFINCVAGQDSARYEYACTLIGYLLHKHKDYSRPFAVILAEENDDENKGGGTGKGIFVTALSKFIKTERVDGKNFKLDKNFALQRVSLDTKMVAIEDCRKNIDFEGFYSVITEGMTVEKKNKDELYIPYKESAKVLFTTNYTISSRGNHAKRRQQVFEFADFFNNERTPLTHFGHNLFEEWDQDEWNRFFNFGFLCVSGYLEHGILPVVVSDKLKRKHLKLKYTENFLEWWDEYFENGCGDWRFASELYHEFLLEYELEKKDFSQTRFGQGMSEAAENYGQMVEKRRNSQPGRKTEIRIVKMVIVNHVQGQSLGHS